MALFFDSTSDALSRTTTLPTITSFTMMAWAYTSATTSYNTLFCFGQNASAKYYSLFRDAAATVLSIYNSVGSLDSSSNSFTTNTWHHIAMTVAGTGASQFLAYIDGVLAITFNGSATPTAAKIWFGNNPDSDGSVGLRLAACKIYSAVLTADEIKNEMGYFVPIRATNLNTWLPCIDPVANTNAIDFSGVGGNMTVGGTLTVVDGPPIAWAPVDDLQGWMAYAAAAAFPGGDEGEMWYMTVEVS